MTSLENLGAKMGRVRANLQTQLASNSSLAPFVSDELECFIAA